MTANELSSKCKLQESERILALDPGREKCGLALVNAQGEPVHLQIVSVTALAATVSMLLKNQEKQLVAMVMGDGTAHKLVLAELTSTGLLDGLPLFTVDEYGTTLAARKLYWRYNRANWWQKLIPAGWRSTPPLDGYAALAIAQRWLGLLPLTAAEKKL